MYAVLLYGIACLGILLVEVKIRLRCFQASLQNKKWRNVLLFRHPLPSRYPQLRWPFVWRLLGALMRFLILIFNWAHELRRYQFKLRRINQASLWLFIGQLLIKHMATRRKLWAHHLFEAELLIETFTLLFLNALARPVWILGEILILQHQRLRICLFHFLATGRILCGFPFLDDLQLFIMLLRASGSSCDSMNLHERIDQRLILTFCILVRYQTCSALIISFATEPLLLLICSHWISKGRLGHHLRHFRAAKVHIWLL